MERPKSSTPDKRDSWNAEDIGTALDSFRPVTITISSFFKQVCQSFMLLVFVVQFLERATRNSVVFLDNSVRNETSVGRCGMTSVPNY